MKPKILVADDSLTIQKVIKITLANEEYELIECTDEQNIQKIIQEKQPDLALLDFNLSNNKTGYDLAIEIKSLGVKKVFMLYGTFDTVDQNLLKHSGVNSHIVKPFEGTKFINTCRQLIEDIGLEDSDTTAGDVESSAPEFPEPIVEDDANWVMNENTNNSTDDYVSDEIVSVGSPVEQSSLDQAAEAWGIDIPAVIGAKQSSDISQMELPPVIEDEEIEESADNFVENTDDSEEQITASTNEEIIPDSDDLEYPDVDMIKSAIEAEVLETPKSQLISVSELANENGNAEAYDQSEGTKTEEEVKNLEALIADEVSENLWDADEVIDNNVSEDDNFEDDSAEELIAAQDIIQSISAESTSSPVSSFDPISSEELEKIVEPLVKKLVEERINQIVERIAWEVIPDLSENLIKKELEKISKEILKASE